MDKIRFALLGCGKIAKKHAEVIHSQIEQAELTAICDLESQRAKEFAGRYGIPWFTDLHTMMKEIGEEIDIVTVLTPSGSHARLTLEVVKYGKHVVVEKPMALTLDDADAMVSACDEAGVKLFVVKQNRYNVPVRQLRAAIDSGRFGKLVLGTVRLRWRRDQDYYDQDPWRGTWRHDGGVFANQAAHHIDLLIWLMGSVESVFAKSATRLVTTETEDTGVVVLRFTNGALGLIEATTATRPKDLEGSVSVLGERGSVIVGGFAANELQLWSFDDSTPEEADQLQNCRNPSDVFAFAHAEYLRSVVGCLSHERQALVDGLEGRKSLELIHAIYESIETGKEVFLRFIPQKCRLGIDKD